MHFSLRSLIGSLVVISVVLALLNFQKNGFPRPKIDFPAIIASIVPPGPAPLATPRPRSQFTYTYSYSFTTAGRAAERFTDFIFETRKAGEEKFTAHPPTSVQPEDNGICVKFGVKLDQSDVEQRFETRFSYRLDGEPKQMPGEIILQPSSL